MKKCGNDVTNSIVSLNHTSNSMEERLYATKVPNAFY